MRWLLEATTPGTAASDFIIGRPGYCQCLTMEIRSVAPGPDTATKQQPLIVLSLSFQPALLEDFAFVTDLLEVQ